MHRFFLLSNNISGNKIVISDFSQAHHIRNVLRLKAEEQVIVCNERGDEYLCIITKLNPDIILEIKETRPPSGAKSKISLTIACAIPKKSNMDDIVDKLTQLGVDRIIPLKTKRVIVDLDAKKAGVRLARWQKIAGAASQQSQRNSIPAVEPIRSIKEVLLESSGDYDLKLIPTLPGERKDLKEVLKDVKPDNILVFIGPEGDFTDDEINLAKEFGCIPVSLGDSVLRVETAAVSVAGFIKFFYL